MVRNRRNSKFGAFRMGSLSVALALVLAGCGASSAESPTDQGTDGLSKVKIIVPVAGTISLTYSVAAANGLFEKYGISPTLVASQGGGPDIAALAAGSVDFDIVCACGIISAFQNGNDLTWSYVVTDEPVGILVMRKSLAEERGITSASSFEDRVAAFANTTVGNTSPGGFMHFMIEYYQTKYGLQGIKEVAVGGGATALSAFKSGAVDALMYTEPVPQQLIADGSAVELLRPAVDAEDLDPFIMETLAHSREYAKQNPEIVEDMVKAMYEATQWILEHSDAEVAELIQDMYPEVDDMEANITSLRGLLSPTGCTTEDGFNTTQTFFKDNGYLKETSAWSDLSNNDHIPNAC